MRTLNHRAWLLPDILFAMVVVGISISAVAVTVHAQSHSNWVNAKRERCAQMIDQYMIEAGPDLSAFGLGCRDEIKKLFFK